MLVSIPVDQFKKLLYDVYNLPQNRKVLSKWPELKAYEAFKLKDCPLDKDKALRYILVLYDKNSPLMGIESIKKRKVQAAEIAGFDLNEKKMPDDKVMTNLILCKNESVCDAILTFAKMHKSHLWETFITLQEIYYMNEHKLLQGLETKYTYDDLYNHSVRLDELRNELVNSDENKTLKEQMHDYVMKELGLKPEDVADRAMKGERVVDIEPYK